MSSRRHLLVGDLQVQPGVRLEHIRHIARYAADKQPAVVVQIGDWNDCKALSSYDRGKASAENKRYSKDCEVFERSVDMFMEELGKAKGYSPRLVFTEGNHCARADRYEQDHPEMMGSVYHSRDYLKSVGWEVYRFLVPVVIDGISYCHLHPRTMNGKVTGSSLKFGAPNALTMVRANMCSVTAGHSPGFQYHAQPVGKRLYHGLILGSSYTHNEKFMSPVGNGYWRGVVMKNRVKAGQYDPCFVSLDYLKERYANSTNRSKP